MEAMVKGIIGLVLAVCCALFLAGMFVVETVDSVRPDIPAGTYMVDGISGNRFSLDRQWVELGGVIVCDEDQVSEIIREELYVRATVEVRSGKRRGVWVWAPGETLPVNAVVIQSGAGMWDGTGFDKGDLAQIEETLGEYRGSCNG